MRGPSPALLPLLAVALVWALSGCPEPDPPAPVDDDSTGDDDTTSGDDDTSTDDDTGDDDTSGDDDTGDDDTGDDDDLAPQPQEGGAVLFTEVMYDPRAASFAYGEWFELLNTTNEDYDLDGCSLSDLVNDVHYIDGSVPLHSFGRVVLAKNADPEINGGLEVDYAYDTDIGMHDVSDALILTCTGVAIDRVEWDTNAGWPGAWGVSMTLTEPDGPGPVDPTYNDDVDLWCSGVTPMDNGLDYASPGLPNIYCPDYADGDGDGAYLIEDCDDTNPAIYPGAPEVPGDGVDDDCDGVVDDEPIEPGDLVIVEVMANPDAADDEFGEWFELLNTTGTDIGIRGCVLSDASGETHEIGLPVTVAPANGRAVLGRSIDVAENGDVPVDYGFGEDMILGNGTDALILECDGQLIDEIEWDTSDDWPGSGGHSMTLDEDYLLVNHSGTNWCAATTQMANLDWGTPGGVNDPC